MTLFGKGKKVKEEGGYTPIQPAVPEGQLGPAAQDRVQRRFKRGLDELGAWITHEASRHQLETGQGKGWESQRSGQNPEGGNPSQLPPASGSLEGRG